MAVTESLSARMGDATLIPTDAAKIAVVREGAPMIRIAALILTVLAFVPPSAHAQTAPLPDARIDVTMDQDFAGFDLSQLFDTTFSACRTACETDTRCTAFTFNTRSNACFPKADVTGTVPYDGALSARVIRTTKGALDLASNRGADLAYLGDSALSDARDLAHEIGRMHPGGPFTVTEMTQTAAARRASGNLRDAMRWTGAAVARSDAADLWADYSDLLLQLARQDRKARQSLNDRALSAALNAYLRAQSDPARVLSLTTLADALEAKGRGRDMIPALRLANGLQPREDIALALDDAIGKYGFRITDHAVDSDLADPRICAEFSEPLKKAGVTYADYVQRPRQDMAVEASGNRLCVTGVMHGDRYSITFRQGLPAQSGETLTKDTEIRAYVRDRTPQVNFPGRAYVLPAAGDTALPVETVNLSQLDLTLYRVTDRNLLRAIQSGYFGQRINRWDRADFTTGVAEEVWTGTADTGHELNREITTRLPMGDVLTGLEPGAYALDAAIRGETEAEPATQWFILTDIGMTTMQGSDGLHVFLHGLGDAQPRAGVDVALMNAANRVLATVATDADGYARFDAGLIRGTGGAAPALLTARQGNDLAFLSLTDPAFDLSDRGVAGREPAPPIDVFLATDRGAYRAGETIHLTALARDNHALAIDGLPVTAILTRPDGVEYARMTSTRDAAGGHVFAVPLGPSVPRGSWRIDIKADVDAPALASRKVLVEDFLPERIDVALDLPVGPLAARDLPDLKVQADYLFGAPGAELDVEADIRLSRSRRLDTFPGYLFGRYDDPAYFRTALASGVTDGNGHATLDLAPDFPDDPLGTPFTLTATVGVTEGSGRPVERQITRVIGPDGPAIGIRPRFTDLGQGDLAEFLVTSVDSDLLPQVMPVTWTVNRVTTRYQWYRQYGNWKWEPFTTRETVTSGSAMLGADPIEISAPTDWGRYELVVESATDPYVAASVDFSAGWHAPADATTTPDMLDLSLDAETYRLGDTAQLRLVPRHAGTALITVMSNRLIDRTVMQVSEGENLIDLPVTEDWGTGAYVTASVMRPMDVAAGQMPARSLGLRHAAVDPETKAISVSIETSEISDPRAPLTAKLQLDGITGADRAFVTVAATDVGILNLTGHKTPDPQGHYFGQQRLGMDIRDLYGRLIDTTDGAFGRVRSGGDAGRAAGVQSPPPTEDLVAFFSGPLEVASDGTAQVSFDIPEFNGIVRLSAIAWTETGVGAAEADVLVRDPVVVSASLPKFLQPGDQSSLLLEIVHATGPAGRMGLDVTAKGLTLSGPVPSGIDLQEQGRETLRIPVIASDTGDHELTVALTTPDGRQLKKTLTLPVRRNDPEIATTRRFELAAGDTFTLDRNVFAGFAPGTGEEIVSAGPLAQVDAPELLATLNRYPYGCTEQITSQAMPLLYLSSVAEAMGLAQPGEVAKRIDQTVERILTRQSANGAFGLWRAEAGDFWLDAYVTDFLSRAQAEGHAINPRAFRMAVDNLRNRINYAPDFDAETNGGGEDVAYALMVLAREGAANMGDLRYYADVKGSDFATPLAAAQLGAALAMYGDQTRADAMFRIAARDLEARAQTPETSAFRADYGTRLRDAAGVLTLAAESGSTAIDRQPLIARLVSRDGPMSTQESAWTLLAAKALINDPVGANLSVDGTPVTGPFVRTTEAETFAPLSIRNEGTAATDITLTTIGVPTTPADAGGYGYAIRRDYYTTDGEATDPAQVPQGTRLVSVLTVTPFEKTGARLMVDDPLPAGFEIDNPGLLRAGDIRALDWLTPEEGAHSEFRSDRFLTAIDWSTDAPFQLAYIVRAITPGQYHHPAATVEDMYRPRYRARTETGRVSVTP